MACYVLSFDGVADKIRIPSSSNNFSLEGFLKDLKNLINSELFNINELVPDTRDTVNIYYSTGENSILSNLAIRPFKLKEHPGIIFKSVEHYFQWYKTYISSDKSLADKILNAETGAEAKRLGRLVLGFNKSYWDSIKQSIMKKGLKASFDLNLDAKKALLSTENKVLTHLLEKGEWGELFPKILTEVRTELLNLLMDNSSLSPSLILFYSGGAKGSDTFWNLVARDFGFSVKNYYVLDYRELSLEEKNEIETIYHRVVSILDRKSLPYTSYAGELVRRDYLQVRDSDLVVAIGKILPKELGSHIDPTISNDEVLGGTAYAVTMGMLKNLPIFVYDLNSSTWKKFNYNTKRFDVFEEILTLTPHSALIGTREVELEIIEPIMREVFELFKVSMAPKLITYSPLIQKILTDLTIIPIKDISTYVSTHNNSISTLRNPDLGIHHLGNPFSHENYRGVLVLVKTVKEAVEAFEKWLRGEAYLNVEPERREWILLMINSGNLSGKELVYYTETIPDNSYGVTKYNYYTAPNHAHILLKLINEHDNQNLSLEIQTIKSVGWDIIDTTIRTLNSDNKELSDSERVSVKSILGDSKPRVLIASEHTDPIFHAKKIKELVLKEILKSPKDRSFHMMYLITKHDGLPLRELAELKIPKFIHFSITSLGGTKYEPGVMKMLDLLDRIEVLIKDNIINPNLCTIRIDPIIPGVTTKEDIRYIIERGLSMGIKQYRFSVMDSYGFTELSNLDRFIVKRMSDLGYDWDTYYGKDLNGSINFHAKREYILDIYLYMDSLAGELGIFINTCGESVYLVNGLKHIKTVGCVNVDSMNAALGTKDIIYTEGLQRKNCSCYGNKVDALRYDDTCASSCVYCYAKHNSDKALEYYNPDGTLKVNRFTLVRVPSITLLDKKDNPILDNIYFKFEGPIEKITFALFKLDLKTFVEDETSSKLLMYVFLIMENELKSIQEDLLDEVFILLKKTKNFTAFALSILANPNIKGMDLFWELDSSDFEELTNLDAEQEELLEVLEPEPRYISKLTTYKTSLTLNKIHRYLEESLKVNPNAEKIKESDTLEALVLITLYLLKLGVNIILKDSDLEMELEGLPKNTEAAVKDGAIYINRSRASLSSPIHELMHIVFAVMKLDNFDLFSSIVLSLRGILEFKDIFELVRQSNYYKNLIESDLLEETFVRYLSGVIDKTINSDDNFELLYTKVYPLLLSAILKTFNIKDMPDIIEFLKSPLSYLTKYNSEIFKERTIETSGYSDSKYKVDISGKIMQFIQDNMGTLILEGKCK